jgi:HEAT repeat protein
MLMRVASIVPLALIVSVAGMAAQQRTTGSEPTPGPDRTEAARLEQGWACLAREDLPCASARANAALAAAPRSGAALDLAIEVDIARAGASSALDTYERWLGSRRIEEPAVLRRIAIALLKDLTRSTQDPAVRLAAYSALLDAGDPDAKMYFAQGVQRGSGAELRVMAARGDAGAVGALATALENEQLPNAMEGIDALAQSHSDRATQALLSRISDPRSEIRSAVATALGQTGDSATIPRLQTMLKDQSMQVRVSAASALYALGDTSGLPLIQQMAAADAPQSRLTAARALASHPDAEWGTLVQGLTSSPDQDVRLAASQLLITRDAGLGTDALVRLANDASGPIAQQATRTIAATAPLDLSDLRAYLRHGDPMVRASTAGRIIKLTN